MALKADIKAAFQANLNATQRGRVLEAFLNSYNYTKDDGQGNQVPMEYPGDNALIADKIVDSIADYMIGVTRAYERNQDVEQLPVPSDVTYS